MKYDPVKKSIGSLAGSSLVRRKLLYKLLGLMFLREWHVKRELRGLLKERSTRLSVLDAGSGFGQYSYFIARNFPHTAVYSVDVKEEQIEDCRRFFSRARLHNVRFAVEDLAQSRHDNEFDLVLSVDVMEHIADDVGVFRNLFAALKPGGVLLVNTPSSLGGSDTHAPGDKSFIEEHARTGYSVEEIRHKLESAGFTVERISFTYGRWGSAAWRLGIKYPMVMANASRFFFLLLPFYYLLTLPFTLLLMYLDYRSENRSGSGLLVLARKP